MSWPRAGRGKSARKCPACDQRLPKNAEEVVSETTSSSVVYDGVAKDLAEHDVVIVRSVTADRVQLRKLGKALERRFPKWRGMIWHMRPSETLEYLPLGMLHELYERLLARFDPDLHRVRMSRKAKALAAAEREASSMTDADARLLAAARAGEQSNLSAVADATMRLEQAAKEGQG